MRFIVLTNGEMEGSDNHHIYLNIDSIVSIQNDGRLTMIIASHRQYAIWVKEKPEEILEKIRAIDMLVVHR